MSYPPWPGTERWFKPFGGQWIHADETHTIAGNSEGRWDLYNGDMIQKPNFQSPQDAMEWLAERNYEESLPE